MPTRPAGSYQPASISYLDAGAERGSFKVDGKTLTAANFDAQVAAWADILAAADALCLGARIEDTYNDQSVYGVAAPTNGAAREVALQLIFMDATSGEKWRANLPTLDISLIVYDTNYGAKDVVLMTSTEVAALIDALEGFVVNPANQAHTVTVIGARVVRGQK